MNFLNEAAKKEVLNKVVYSLPKIIVKAGRCRYNFRCQMNAVHEAIRKKDDKIVMCFYIDQDYPIIHFLNYRKGKYIDNTFGEWTKTYNYHFIKFIDKADFFSVDQFFTAYRKELRQNLSFWNRVFSNIEF